MQKKEPRSAKTSVALVVAGLLLAGTTPSWGWDCSLDGIQEREQMAKESHVGTIKGRILDYETQEFLDGVSVTIKDTDWNARSDSEGTYVFPGIPVGYYVLAFELEGYYTDTRTDVSVRPDRITFLNVQMLKARSITEEVRVTADYFPKTPDKPGSKMQDFLWTISSFPISITFPNGAPPEGISTC